MTHDKETNVIASTFTRIDASPSVSRLSPRSIELKNRSLSNTKHKRRNKKSRDVENHVRNHNKTHVTSTVNAFKANVSVMNVNDVNVSKANADVLCLSCGKSVYSTNHANCVAECFLSVNLSGRKDILTASSKPKPIDVIQLSLWIFDSRCSKHITGNLKLLINFVEKFIGAVIFGNDHFAAIIGFGDYVYGNIKICR
ncbi:hypothetical protein Tco_1053446 [Tanacetum coccineum]